MPLYEPANALRPALLGTVLSGATAVVALGSGNEYIQVERRSTSAGTLTFVLGEGAIATEYYDLSAAQPLSGFMPSSPRTATIGAVGGDVDYRIWRLGTPA